MHIKLPPLKLWPTLRSVALLIISLIGGYKGIVSATLMEKRYLREREKNIELTIANDSLETNLWAQEVLVENLSENVVDCHQDFSRLPYELWYKKLEVTPLGEWQFLMVFVNKPYEDHILGGRSSATDYITQTDYFAHPDNIAKQYWDADALVVRFWKKIRFHEKVKMADGSIRTALVEKWPERRGNDVYVFGMIIRYID